MIWLLLAQLATFAITNAYAQQRDRDVEISITYTTQKPVRVCISAFAISDREFAYAMATQCLTPKSDICDWDTWKDYRIDETNFMVSVTYSDGHVDVMYLTKRIDT